MPLRRLPELWRRLDVTVRDLPLGLLFAALSFVPALQGHETQVGEMPSQPFGPVTILVLALLCLPLAGRRRWPAACLALVSLGFAISSIGGYHTVAGTTLVIALVSAGLHLERGRRATLVAMNAAYLVMVYLLVLYDSPEPADAYVVFYILVAMAWGIGSWLRSTRVAESERRRRVAESTRTAERTRIARELHDVVTHHVTAMVVQAEAARYLTAAPDRLDQALTAVSDTGRRATTDLRHLLDLLNPDHDTETRTPPVGRLLSIVEQTRQAGQPVEFSEDGDPPASTGGADLVAYRVVQESLTNALKYAHGNPTAVRVRHRESEITVEVSTDGPGTAGPIRSGSGRGLAGLRDRVDVLGGEFDAGAHDGGFLVRARIPAQGSAT